MVQESALNLLRWIISADAGRPWRHKEEIVVRHVGPAVRDLRIQRVCDFYVSPQGESTAVGLGHLVWLTAFASPSTAEEIMDLIGPYLAGCDARFQIKQSAQMLNTGDEYQSLLTQSTRFALDLHLKPDLEGQQRELAAIAGGSQDPRTALANHIENCSPAYAAEATASRKRYWSAFYQAAPLPNLSPPGHWIWNIVLGGDFGNAWPPLPERSWEDNRPKLERLVAGAA